MIFPDTHEAIIDQDTWDIAQKLRVRAKPRAANGTYSHRLSGMIYCADCGSRMGFISPEARQSGKHYDSEGAFAGWGGCVGTRDFMTAYQVQKMVQLKY